MRKIPRDPRRLRSLLLVAVPGLALLLALFALPRLGPDVAGPEWRVVARFPFEGRWVERLRPFVGGVEVCGTDRVTGFGPDGEWSETGAAPPPWEEVTRLAAAAGRLRDRPPLDAAFVPDRAPDPFVAIDEGRASLRARWTGHAEGAARGLEGLPWRGEIPSPGTPLDLELTLDPATGVVVQVVDRRLTDGVEGQALAFDPNPVVTSGLGGLRDGMDVDGYRALVPLTRLEGRGVLRGSAVRVESRDAVRARESSEVYLYSSRDPRFEEVMAYYHGDRSLERVEERGFGGALRRPLMLVVHASAFDNSWYSRSERAVFLGDGGVDDAEDADIILHETGHAIHDALVPGFGGGDTQAISEGFSDFWAASLTGDPCIGDWDATSYAPPCLRRTDTEATWPASMSASPHKSGEIWSALLWDIRALLGPKDAERLALGAFLTQGTRTTYPEAARGLLDAAERLGLGAREDALRERLARRGLVAREVHLTLAAEEVRALPLLSVGRYLGNDVRALAVDGRGALTFLPALADSAQVGRAAFPEGPPSLCPLAPAGEATALTAEIRATIDAERASGEIRWNGGAGSVARVAWSWDLTSGDAGWTWLELEEGRAWRVGVTASSLARDGVRSLSLEELLGGVRGASGFESVWSAGVSSPEGASFRITQRAGSSGFDALVEHPPLAVADLSVVVGIEPNPFRDASRISLWIRDPGTATLSLHDLLGREVRRIELQEPLPAGLHLIPWDGRDGHGRILPGGLYFLRAEAAGRSGNTRVLKLR